MRRFNAGFGLALVATLASGAATHARCASPDRRIVEKRGGTVAVVRFDDGAWQLQVNSQPYFIKGVVYSPMKIGEDPNEGTMRDWMTYDDNHNGLNDMAYETWRNIQSAAVPVGDFKLMKEMGVNTIRLYHLASDNPVLGGVYRAQGVGQISLCYDRPLNKALLRDLYKKYGIRTIVGNYLGSWTIGSGSSWEAGTDYTDPVQRENIKKTVRAMVLDNKAEPYVLFWLLGNENNIADWSHCNAKQQPEAYARLVGELVDMVHEMDPQHPVGVCDGDDLGGMLNYYAKYAKGIDIVGYNAYRGAFGFGALWRTAYQNFKRPIFISEFGTPAFNSKRGEDQVYQESYLTQAWKDIVLQSGAFIDADKNRLGISLGGTVFDWIDRWYFNGNPARHDPGTRPDPHLPDGLLHEEYWGLLAMDDGLKHDSLMRRPRKAYEYFKKVWNDENLAF